MRQGDDGFRSGSIDRRPGEANRAAVAAPTRANFVMLFALGLIWGGAFMGIELALRGYGPATVAAGRLTLGALALMAFTALSAPNGPAPARFHIPWIIAIGFFGTGLPFLLLAWGQTVVSSGFAGVAMAMVALFVLPLAHFLVPGDQMTKRKASGFALGFAGVAVLLGPGLLVSGWSGTEVLGRLACLGAACCYAIASICTRLSPPIDSVALARWQLIIGAACILPVALIVDGVPRDLPIWPSLALLALALLPTALGAWMRVRIIRTAGPSFMSTVSFQVPVWAVVLGIVFLDEDVSLSLFAALGLILAGMGISQWSTIRKFFANSH